MKFVADLHLHSKYSRAVSQNMVLPEMEKWAIKKGIDVLSASDFTHPLWFREIKNQLKDDNGVYKLKDLQSRVRFILSTEISSIYTQGGKVRRIHNLVFVPNIETAEKLNSELLKRGCNLSSDGRPIIGLSSRNLLEIVLSTDPNAFLIPCHAWTPWFSLYGSNSGFDSIEECFQDLSSEIFGIETGLSSDPEMNWRIKELESRSILSFSDAHSPAKMGREATVFVTKDGISNIKSGHSSGIQMSNISFNDIKGAIKKDPKSNLEIAYTIEFYPEEGKYHYTGHRNCGVVQTPDETREKGAVCPVCKRLLTVGVMHRVGQLADPNYKLQITNYKLDEYGVRWIKDSVGKQPPFVKLVPLLEILAESLSSTVSSLKVKEAFDRLVDNFGSEINVLLKTGLADIERVSGSKVSDGIKKVRSGDITIAPGFDGEFGRVKIWPEDHQDKSQQETVEQKSLF